jgi:hypothetical protein
MEAKIDELYILLPHGEDKYVVMATYGDSSHQDHV